MVSYTYRMAFQDSGQQIGLGLVRLFRRVQVGLRGIALLVGDGRRDFEADLTLHARDRHIGLGQVGPGGIVPGLAGPGGIIPGPPLPAPDQPPGQPGPSEGASAA